MASLNAEIFSCCEGTILNEAADLNNELKALIRSYFTTQAIYVVAELGIADMLSDGPQRPEALARHANVRGDLLYRILRALTTIGIFAEDEQGRFDLTPLAAALRSPGTRAFARLHGSELYQAWGVMLETIRSGKPPFERAHGVSVFEYLTAHPNRGDVFDQAIASNHAAEIGPMLDAYDMASFKDVVDVGGGNGNMLVAILRRYPHMRGVLFDLPSVAERARPIIDEAGLADRCRVVAGSFLDPGSVPSGADAYLARHVVHDWNDVETVKILRQLKQAGGAQGKALVVEIVVPDGDEPHYGKWSDLMMLCLGGKERTALEYEDLYRKAGLQLSRIIPTSCDVSILEGVSQG